MASLLQRRGVEELGPFTLFCGVQLQPGVVEMVGAHAHEQPHLLIVTRPPGPGPDPEYRIWYRNAQGEDVPVAVTQFGYALIRAGFVHWIEQTVPGARGGYVCIFANYDANGRIADVMREATPGVEYVDG